VNVTEVPEQIVVPGFTEIETEGIRIGFTTIVIVFDVTVAGDAQASLDVS
jgi:hypothetical protein